MIATPAKSVADLIAMAKKSPGQLSFASTGIGPDGSMLTEDAPPPPGSVTTQVAPAARLLLAMKSRGGGNAVIASVCEAIQPSAMHVSSREPASRQRSQATCLAVAERLDGRDQNLKPAWPFMPCTPEVSRPIARTWSSWKRAA